MIKVSEEDFRLVLEWQLGGQFDRAMTVFRGYGKHLRFQVYTTMVLASAYGKVPEVLKLLEKHFENHLGFQHPDIRGLISNRLLGVNETHQMFIRIHETYFE